MNTARITVLATIALAAFVPVAHAGSSDASVDASTTTATAPATTTTATTPTASTPATTTTATTETPATTTTTTTDGGVPVTTPDASTTTTTDTETDDLGLGDLGTDIPADVAAGAGDCIDATCAMANAAGVVPTAVGAGASLPFTGISDMVAPIMLALVVLLAGVVAIRWAQLREAVARHGARRVINGAALVSKTGYAAAMREQVINDRARNFYGPRVA